LYTNNETNLFQWLSGVGDDVFVGFMRTCHLLGLNSPRVKEIAQMVLKKWWHETNCDAVYTKYPT